MKCTVVLMIFVLKVVYIRHAESVRTNVWSNNPVYNGFKSLHFIEQITVRSRLECGTFCQQKSTCLAFVYFQQTCQLLDGFLNSMSVLEAMLNAKYAAMGHVDAMGFRTVELPISGVFIYKIIGDGANKDGAVLGCNSLGGHLVRLSTMEKITYLLSVIRSTPDCFYRNLWVDGSNADASDFSSLYEWKFSNGDALPGELWPAGFQLDNAPYRHCVHLWWGVNWDLDDTHCTDINWYICEK